MEKHKSRALAHFLERSKKPLSSYILSLREIAQDVMDAYDTLPPTWDENTDEFLELMIRDGCFMLEILRTSILMISSCFIKGSQSLTKSSQGGTSESSYFIINGSQRIKR
ncbi:hypothetical protein ACH5RR_036505 [Cinchona calisaya]|uniref:Uncharacterized protein n=1 Tax=Cinchona calisaya TaxID=153742 RepID=A0ABD2Y3D9_9GENT